MNEDDKIVLRTSVDAAYDLQQTRIQSGNRLAASFRRKAGEEPAKVEGSEDSSPREVKEDEDDTKMLDVLKASYNVIRGADRKKIPDKRTFKPHGPITTYPELVMVDHWMALRTMENQAFRRLEAALEPFPIFQKYLSTVSGVGPAMAAVIIAYMDPHKAPRPSHFWSYVGLDVAPDGRARSMRKEHLVERSYIKKDGTEGTRMGLTFNPFVRTKLLGVLADSFIRVGSPWRKVYDDYKHRLQTDPSRIKATSAQYKGLYKSDPERAARLWTPKRIDRAAKRYMVKLFLNELWNRWRAVEGLEIVPTYQEAKLNHAHAA